MVPIADEFDLPRQPLGELFDLSAAIVVGIPIEITHDAARLVTKRERIESISRAFEIGRIKTTAANHRARGLNQAATDEVARQMGEDRLGECDVERRSKPPRLKIAIRKELRARQALRSSRL